MARAQSFVERRIARVPGHPLRRSTDHPQLAPAGHVELVRSREALDALAPEWRELAALAPGAVLFQTHAWAAAVFDFEAARGNWQFEPLILTLRRRGELLALLPLERIRSHMRRTLVPLGDGFAQYSDILVRPGTDARAALAEMLVAAQGVAPSDLLRFLKVRGDSILASALPEAAFATGAPEAAPAVELGNYPDFPAYFATRKPKTRKNMRNARNRLERSAPLTHAVAATPDEVQGVIDRTLQGRADRLREQGLTSRAFSSGLFAQFCRTLADRDDPELSVLAMSLRHGDSPAAEQWGLVYNGRYYAYVAARDFSNSDESPGKLHLRDVLEACAARGVDTADLLVPSMPYKLTWATAVVPVRDFAVPLNPWGTLSARAWDGAMRPWLKNAVLSTPPQWRTAAMRLLGRSAATAAFIAAFLDFADVPAYAAAFYQVLAP